MANKNNNLQQQEKLIAVLLLDSYSVNFAPLNSKRAECLLPLFGNKTLLDNNIEYLIENNVEEIFLFCTNHHLQIKDHIDKSKWKKRVEIHFLYNFKCASIGDAMREIECKNLISSNFILITANTILGNVKLNEYLELHKQVSKMDKNAVITMLCQQRLSDLSYEFNKTDASSLMNQSNMLIIHNNSNRILYYDVLDSNKKVKCLRLPSALFANAYHQSKQLTGYTPRPDVINTSKAGLQSQDASKTIDSIQHLKKIQHRNDLIETQIYLCSPYVLHMFTDNFDYETMSDFIRGILNEEEVAGYTAYIDIIDKKPGNYLATINNLNSYYFQTLNLIKRIELILDATERSNYNRVSDKCNSYVSTKSVCLGKNVLIDRNVLIDANCKIGDNCELINCLISSNCVIGNNVKLSNCILWPNTRIGNDSVLNACFLGYNVKIGDQCNLCENCMFSNHCHVKDNTNLTKRGVFVPVKAIKDQSEEAKKLGVNEDNYTKYYLKSDQQNEDDDDDEFETDEDIKSEQNHETESVVSTEDKNQNNDTETNSHFLVWKSKSKLGQIKNKLLREQDEEGNELEGNLDELNNLDDSEFSDDSSSDESLSDDEDEQDFEETNTLKPAVSSESLRSGHNEEDGDIFTKEAVSIVKRGFIENLDVDNVILEINSCKHAHNIQIEDLNYYLTRVVFDMPFILNKSNQFDYMTVIKQEFEKVFGKLCQNYYTKVRKSQIIFLNGMLDYFVEAKPVNNVNLLDTVYLKLVNYLYNDEKIGFLSDEVILEWYKSNTSNNTISEKHKSGLKKLEKFIEWLEDEDEDDEEEEDDDDDE